MLKSLSLILLLSATASYADGWEYFEEDNPLTGKPDSWANFLSKKPTTENSGLSYPMILFVSCLEGQFSISVDTDEYMGRGRLRVRYRADENEPITENWVASSDGIVMFLPPSYKDFEKSLNTAQTIAMEFQDYRGVVYRTLFVNLDENRNNVSKIYKNCGEVQP